ncbi:MAG: amidohydrolase family protein [Geodermatophilaceae bacterium]
MSTGFDLVVRGGEIVTGQERYLADVGVRDGKISAIGIGLRSEREIDATDRLVIPGAIDGHVHMRTERTHDVYDDTFRTGSTAAAFGGVTTMIDQIQVEPGQTLTEGIDRRLAEAEGESLIDYGFHINLREASRERIAEMRSVAERGFRRFKFFMFYEGYALPDEIIFAAMQTVGDFGGLSIVHAENRAVILELMRQNVAAGRSGPLWNARARPAGIEGEATHRALAMAHAAGSAALIFHMTSADGVRELGLAKQRGQLAYGEVCPQYLLLGEEAWDTPDGASALDFSPPLRDATHRAALWSGLDQDVIDIVSTDHGPRRRRPDAAGRLTVPPGTTGIETRLALLYSEGVRTGRLSLHRWVDACCSRPARVHGLAGKGHIRPGYDADLVVFDPHRSMTLTADVLHSAVDHCTYEGVTVTGVPVATVARGRVLVDDGVLADDTGRGQLVDRALAYA